MSTTASVNHYNAPCEICGSPATEVSHDLQEDGLQQDEQGKWWHTYKSYDGTLHYRCLKHPREPLAYSREGELLNA